MEDTLYQTLEEFIGAPFGVPDPDTYKRLSDKYRQNIGKIKLHGCIEYEKTFMLHIKIPSESKPGATYDVVIQFLPGDDSLESESTLNNYYIQFFSNSPSFVYRYAVLYKNKGYMIDALQEKMDPNYADALPTKTNAGMKMTYDKSLFFACVYLLENKKTLLNKTYLKRLPRMNFNRFIDGVTNYNGEKFDFDIYQIEANFKKELVKDLQKAGQHMKLKPKERKGLGILPRKKPLNKIKPKGNTFNSKSFNGMTLRTTVKPKKTGSANRKPRVLSTARKPKK